MSLFTILPISVDDASLPVIPSSDIEFFGEGELAAYGHWLFGGGQTSLQDVVNSRLLTLQNASYPPTYAQDYLSHSGIGGRALLSDFLEPTTTGGYTICAVQRIPVGMGGLAIPHGTLGQTPNPVTGGSIFFDSEQNANTTRPVYATYRGPVSSQDTGLDLNLGAWFFLATSISYTNLSQFLLKVFLGKGGVSQTYQQGPVGTSYTRSASPVALGSAYYNLAGLGSMDTAEFMIFSSSLSLADIEGVYERSKVRMARRGIVI